MKVEDVVGAVLQMEPTDLRALFDRLGSVFAQRAEQVYDRDPEENGTLAQPYADIADLCREASFVFDGGQPSLDVVDEKPDAPPDTVSAAVAQRSVRSQKNPWGGR